MIRASGPGSIAFGWQDLEIVNGAPGARRNFIDGFAGAAVSRPSARRSFGTGRCWRAATISCSRAEPGVGERLEPWDEQLALTVGRS